MYTKTIFVIALIVMAATAHSWKHELKDEIQKYDERQATHFDTLRAIKQWVRELVAVKQEADDAKQAKKKTPERVGLGYVCMDV